MVSLDTEAEYENDTGYSRHPDHFSVDEEGVACTVMICFEMTFGDMVAVANLKDERHVYSAGKRAKSLIIDRETFTTVDEHADTEHGIGRAKTIFVYDLNDPVTGECYYSEITATTNKDGMTNEKVGRHNGTDCHERRKETTKDSMDTGSPAKSEEKEYVAGYRLCRYMAAELSIMK